MPEATIGVEKSAEDKAATAAAIDAQQDEILEQIHAANDEAGKHFDIEAPEPEKTGRERDDQGRYKPKAVESDDVKEPDEAEEKGRHAEPTPPGEPKKQGITASL